MNRFRPIYIAAFAVMLLGLFGAPIVGKSHNTAPLATPIEQVPVPTHWKSLLALLGTGSLSLAGLLTLAGPRH